MSYEINACKACHSKFTDINDIRDCCYNTVAAYSGESSMNAIINSPAAAACNKCVMDVAKDMGPFGKDSCDFRLAAPPIWGDPPHYFPGYLKEGHSPEEALQLCKKECAVDTPYHNGCVDNCEMDHAALVVPKNSLSTTSFDKNNNNILLVVSGLMLILLFVIIIAVYRK